MIFPANASFSSFSWGGIGATLANHLWQSTVFAGVVWLLILCLRKNHAQARYLLWLIASAKFLISFSLLIGLGSHWASSKTAAITQPEFLFAIQTISQPFSSTNPTPISSPVPPSRFAGAVRFLPVFLLVVWLSGCFAVFCVWWLRWRRLQMARRAGLLAKSGREFEALRRVEQSGRRNGQLDVILSESALEPGILGVFCPVLLLPAGISERLNDDQLDAILMHELCHVRRHDNLVAALHMLVEALFWFHPLVWWIGGRLVDERERACDEDVLRLGTDPHVYAESILNVCRFYVESPLFCAAGVTGSNLKKRIEAIIIHRATLNLGFGKKLLLATIGVAAMVGPVAFGLLHAAQPPARARAQDTLPPVPAFESVSIKPNSSDTPTPGFPVKGKPFTAVLFKPDRFMATNVTLQGLIRVAYGVQDSQIVGGPQWLNSENYDMDATIGRSLVDQLSKLSKEEAGLQRGRILQAFLADRFKLTLHRETREVPGYALLIAKGGPKFQQAKPGETYASGVKDPHGRPIGGGNFETGPCKLIGQAVPVGALAFDLSQKMSSIVVDETNLKGNYDFALDCHTAFMERGDSLLTVLPEQLGLELNAQAVPVEVLVIDHAEEIASDEPTPSGLQTQSTSSIVPSFEAVTIKPNKTGGLDRAIQFTPDRFIATNVSLHALIAAAYVVGGSEILGGPDWVRSKNYDVEAKLDTPVIDELSKLGPDQRSLEWRRILQALLADRFRLALHRESREPPAYVLAIARDGFKLQEAKLGDTYPDGFKDAQGRPLGAGALLQPGPCKLAGQGVHMADLAKTLSMNYLGGRTVVDQTGLRGVYDFTLDCHTAFVQRGESVLTALPEQLGLELKLLDNLVIDSAEEPSEN